MYTISQYLKFLIRSTNQHGVHSPFVYDLVTKCFYDKTQYKGYHSILDYRKQLLNNQLKIEVFDLGAGSKKMKPKERSVYEITKNAGTTTKRAKLLYRTIQYFKPQSILELGTSLGIASYSMYLGNPKSNIESIEGCPKTAEFSKEQLRSFGAEHINIINSDFNSAINNLNTKTYDVIFFDGNHQKEATLNYFKMLLKKTHNDSVFIFDDIYWSPEMSEAWDEIKNHPKVTLTIDTFFWGFVFFRTEQNKEHFSIRL